MLILFLTMFNSALLLGISFWAINKNCSRCQQEMPGKRIFTFKEKCSECERSPWAFDKDQEGRNHE